MSEKYRKAVSQIVRLLKKINVAKEEVAEASIAYTKAYTVYQNQILKLPDPQYSLKEVKEEVAEAYIAYTKAYTVYQNQILKLQDLQDSLKEAKANAESCRY